MTRVAILQSNYIPWKGYFDLIASVDEFVIYDEVQYTHQDWRNRNRIKTPKGLVWLTVAVPKKGRLERTIAETRLQGVDWAAAHWAALHANYRKARHFDDVADWLEPIYKNPPDMLSELNVTLIEAINAYLGIGTRLTSSTDYASGAGKVEKLVRICTALKADTYVSGPAARDYLDEAAFASAGIEVSWFDYAGYGPYPQLWGPFEHAVSVLDLLFNTGPDAPNYMKLGRVA